jgi:predicted TIM-barrel fold metal-dependent hydrolase
VTAPLPTIDDDDSGRVPDGLDVVDAHVHIFPPGFAAALWRWFDAHAWRIRYQIQAEQVVELLASRGVRRMVALTYAHKPGVAQLLNRFVAEAARRSPQLIALGTVFPGEPDERALLAEALGPLGLRGLKLHCHVQRMAADDPRLEPAYSACEAAGLPLVIHCGSAPATGGYGVDVHTLAGADRMERVLERHPRLTVVVPHLGQGEADDYARLLDRHERLYLDTTMVVGGYFPGSAVPVELIARHPDRILYGTDFPNLPYRWNRELDALTAAPLDEQARRAVLGGNARRVFGE